MILLFLSLSLLSVSSGLVLKGVHVPMLNIAGNSAVLSCDFDREGEEIYSVKWYKGGREIFRYLPSAPSTYTVYSRDGVNIDQDKSNYTAITISNLTLASTGRYRCEVSTEAPQFSSTSGYGDLLVLVLPPGPPIIRGGQQEYSPGDFVQLNCTSYNSKPAPDLIWYINENKADPSYVVQHPVVTSKETGLHNATSSLYLTLGERHFNSKGEISISCTASIKLINWRNAAKTLAEKKP